MKPIFSLSLAAAAIALAFTGPAAYAQAAAGVAAPGAAPSTSFAAPGVQAASATASIAAALTLCMPQTLSVIPFEQSANGAGWTAFRTSTGEGKLWRVSDRNADPSHRVSVAAASGDLTGAPQRTHQFNCKIVLQPGTAEDFHAGLASVFGEDQTDGGFFILENGTLRPQTVGEAMVEFPQSLGSLRAGQRMIFMQVDQRGPAVVVSIDTFEPAAH